MIRCDFLNDFTKVDRPRILVQRLTTVGPCKFEAVE